MGPGVFNKDGWLRGGVSSASTLDFRLPGTFVVVGLVRGDQRLPIEDRPFQLPRPDQMKLRTSLGTLASSMLSSPSAFIKTRTTDNCHL